MDVGVHLAKQKPGLAHSVGSCCFLSDLPTLPEFLNKDCLEHEGLLGA